MGEIDKRLCGGSGSMGREEGTCVERMCLLEGFVFITAHQKKDGEKDVGCNGQYEKHVNRKSGVCVCQCSVYVWVIGNEFGGLLVGGVECNVAST